MASYAQPSVSSLYAGALSTFLRDSGYPGRSRDDKPPVSTPANQRVDGHSYAHALITGVRELGDNALGLAFGSRVGGAGFGMLGIAAATAPTLRQSVQYLTRMESITSTLGQAAVRQYRNQVILSWTPAQVVPPAVIEGILTGWVSFGRYMLGERVDVTQVSFAHPRMATMDAYETALDCPVRFNTSSYSVTMAAELLDARPRFADTVLNEALSGWMSHCVAAIPSANKVHTHKVASLLGSTVHFAEANESVLAARLGMGLRSLQRRLHEEGTTFRQVLDAARAQRALIMLLRGDSTLTDLCADIGFDEQSSYCRSFRKWTGYSPLTFKHRLSDVFCDLRPANA